MIVRGQASIGVAGSTGSGAKGGLTVAGDLETGDRLGIGVTSAGVAYGSAVVGGDLRVVASEDQLGNGLAEVLVGSTYNTIPETPEPATMGSLWIVGDMSAIFDGAFRTTSLDVGFAHGATRQASGFAQIDGDLLGFTDVAVGFAEADDPFATGADAFAQGELHVAGKLADSPLPSGYPRSLSVGVTTAFPINSSNAGSARAEAIATIGEIEGRNVAVGIAGSGPATGRLEIGGGDMLAAIVGQTTSDFDAEGTLTTGGGIQISAMVGVSEGGGAFQFSCQCVTPFVTGDAVGSLVADGFVYSATVGLLRSDGSAIGSLEVEGVHPSFQSSPGSVLVGYSDRGGAAGTAEGRMSVGSGGIEASRIAVGVLEGSMFPASNPPRPSGTVVGVLETTGDVTSRGGVGLQPGDVVGYGNAFSHGDADGTWILHDGTYTGRTDRRAQRGHRVGHGPHPPGPHVRRPRRPHARRRRHGRDRHRGRAARDRVLGDRCRHRAPRRRSRDRVHGAGTGRCLRPDRLGRTRRPPRRLRLRVDRGPRRGAERVLGHRERRAGRARSRCIGCTWCRSRPRVRCRARAARRSLFEHAALAQAGDLRARPGPGSRERIASLCSPSSGPDLENPPGASESRKPARSTSSAPQVGVLGADPVAAVRELGILEQIGLPLHDAGRNAGGLEPAMSA